jgi:hypothetical protein
MSFVIMSLTNLNLQRTKSSTLSAVEILLTFIVLAMSQRRSLVKNGKSWWLPETASQKLEPFGVLESKYYRTRREIGYY